MVNPPNRPNSPPSADAAAWRRIAQAGNLGQYAPETLIAAFQDAGGVDRRLREAMAAYLSAMVMRVLRRRVGANKMDGGKDIIDEVHDGFFIANSQPNSADAKAYRVAFLGRLMYRLKDAIAAEEKATVIEPPERTEPNDGSPLGAIARAQEVEENAADAFFEREEIAAEAGARRPDPGLLQDAELLVESIDVERILGQVADRRKRLAFRLHMDGVPFGGDKGTVSIARTLGISRKTAEHWVADVRAFLLTQVPAVQQLKQRAAGE